VGIAHRFNFIQKPSQRTTKKNRIEKPAVFFLISKMK